MQVKQKFIPLNAPTSTRSSIIYESTGVSGRIAKMRGRETYILHFAIVCRVRDVTRIEQNGAEEVVRAGEDRDSKEEIRNGVSRNYRSTCQHSFAAREEGLTVYEASDPDVNVPDDTGADDSAEIRTLHQSI